MPRRGESEETRQTAEDSGGEEATDLGMLRIEGSDVTEAAHLVVRVEAVDLGSDAPQGSPLGRSRFELAAEAIEVNLEAPGVVRSERPSIAIGMLGSTSTGKSTFLSHLVHEAEDEAPVQRDGAFYDEVRKAVGRGTPSVLLGTSTRSLKRHMTRLKDNHENQ
jgi:hypothetical protein